MICFEIFINGEKQCTAGVGEFGVLDAHIIWANRIRLPDEAEVRIDGKEDVDVYVSGLEDYELHRSEPVKWMSGWLPLGPGDEVLVRLVESDTPDAPLERGYPVLTPQEMEFREASTRRLYESLKRRYEGG